MTSFIPTSSESAALSACSNAPSPAGSGSSASVLLRAEAVSFSYRNERKTLDGVSLDIHPGDFVCLMGANGSGKTTFALHANALLLPTSGAVLVEGMQTSDPGCTHLIRSKAALVFQNPDDQLVNSVVADDVAFGPENLGLDPAEIEQRVAESLVATDLAELANRDVSTLSGGQKQRLAIADALAMKPSLLVLDEATSMLDPRSRVELLALCKKLNDEGTTILMITHFPDEALAAKRLVLLESGRIVADGTPSEVFSARARIEELGLSAPLPLQLGNLLYEQGAISEQEYRRINDEDSLIRVLSARSNQGLLNAENGESESSTSAETDAGGHLSDLGKCSCIRDGQEYLEDSDESTRENDEPLLSLERVSFSYGQQALRVARKGATARWKRSTKNEASALPHPHSDVPWALDQICMHVRAGETVGIAGASGSGKSTLLKCLAGLISPQCGERKTRHDVLAAGGIGLLFQYPEHQLFGASVIEDVSFGPKNLGLNAEEARERACRALKEVGLDPEAFGMRSPFALSQGEQRRVCLAGILAMQPSIIALDEPFAGLDPAGQEELMALVARLNRAGNAIVMASHDMEALERCCQHIAVMDAGSIVMSGSPRQVFAYKNAHVIRKLGLELPPVRALALRISEAGIPLGQRLLEQQANVSVVDLADSLRHSLGARP